MNRSLIIILSCFLCVSCASHYGAANIISHPPGAEVIDADTNIVIGVTPTTTWWKDDNGERKYIILRFDKGGFDEKTVPYWLSMRHKSLKAAKKSPQLFETSLEKRRD